MAHLMLRHPAAYVLVELRISRTLIATYVLRAERLGPCTRKATIIISFLYTLVTYCKIYTRYVRGIHEVRTRYA